MKRVLKKLFSIVFVVILALSNAVGLFNPVITANAASSNASNGNLFYIKNSYAQGSYLYEANGVLRYGIPTKGDKYFQWIVENKGSDKAIKNVATNHYVTLQGHSTSDNSYTDPVPCMPWQNGDDTYLWKFGTDDKQNILSASKKYDGFVLHLEGITSGQVAGQKISGDQLSWGNMQWFFYKESDINFEALARDGFCIQSTDSGAYLRDENGTIKYGVPAAPDDSYIWVITQQPDGTKLLKNKKTSKFISMTNYNSKSFSLGTSDNDKSDKLNWNFEIAIQTEIISASKSYSGYGLNLPSGGSIQCINLNGSASTSQKWNIVPAAKVANVVGPLVLENKVYNLKNCWTSMYLIEDNGQPVYGNANASDANAQWQIVYDPATKKTALINKGTGHYLHPGAGQNGLTLNSVKSFYWNLLRNQSDLYTSAVVFQDSTDPTRFLHMESMNGYIEDSNAVQPTWGTPHWEPVAVTGSSTTSTVKKNDFKVPSGYIRMQSKHSSGLYLYESASEKITYQKSDASDPRSHWEIVKSDKNGLYYLKNRQTGQYAANMGNGVLRCFSPEQATIEGSLWQVVTGNDANVIMLQNKYSGVKEFQQPFLNIHELSGLAKSTLVSGDDPTAQWIYEKAPDKIKVLNDSSSTLQLPLTVYNDTNVYKILYNDKYIKGTYTLEYIGNAVIIKNTANGKYLYFKGGLKSKSTDNQYDKSLQWTSYEKLGASYLKNGSAVVQLEKTASSSVYNASNAQNINGALLFTVYSSQAGKVQVQIDGTANTSVSISVNGISNGKVTLPAKNITLNFVQGINTVAISEGKGIKSLTVLNSINKALSGASVNYQSYEAEDSTTNGTVIPEDRTFKTTASEASGRSAVELQGTGRYVRFKLTKPANALVIRYSIPDTEDGKGQDQTLDMYANGVKAAAIPMSSTHSWLYGAYPWSNNPSDGSAHNFYDEVNVILDKTYSAGTLIKLEKSAYSHAASYIIDVVETELIGNANSKPANSLSLTDFGAVANDGKDDSAAFAACLAASGQQNKEIWIPVGTFDVDQKVSLPANTVIRGSGMWRSAINGISFTATGDNVGLYDFSMRGTAITRRDEIDPAAVEDRSSSTLKNITVQNLWIQHYKVGMWLGNIDGLHIAGNRIRDTYADGINLSGGVNNAVVEQNDIRSTGDDGIAMWSNGASDTNIIIRNNNVSLPWLANAIALYGGTNITVRDNNLKDTITSGAGINISTNFKPQPFAGKITVLHNSLIRCGSVGSSNQNIGAVWFNTIVGYDNNADVNLKDNVIFDSSYQGVSFGGGGLVKHVQMDGNVIEKSGTYGIDVAGDARGSVTGTNNLIIKSAIKDINNSAKSAFTINLTVSPIAGSIWNPTLIILVSVSGAVLLIGLIILTLILLMELGKIKKDNGKLRFINRILTKLNV